MSAIRIPFQYGERADIAELVLEPAAAWGLENAAAARLVAHPGEWKVLGPVPDTLIGKQMIKAAEEASGLAVRFRATPWRIEGEKAVRALVFVGDNSTRIAALLPPEACG